MRRHRCSLCLAAVIRAIITSIYSALLYKYIPRKRIEHAAFASVCGIAPLNHGRLARCSGRVCCNYSPTAARRFCMGGFFESFLRVAVIVLIVGPVTAWVARVGAKERGDANESTECFTVRLPRAPRLPSWLVALSRSRSSCWSLKSGRASPWGSGTISWFGWGTAWRLRPLRC